MDTVSGASAVSPGEQGLLDLDPLDAVEEVLDLRPHGVRSPLVVVDRQHEALGRVEERPQPVAAALAEQVVHLREQHAGLAQGRELAP